MKFFWSYWPEPLICAIGLWALRAIEPRLGAGMGRWFYRAGVAWLSVVFFLGLGGMLGWHPPVAVMLMRGYALAFAGCLVVAAGLGWLWRALEVDEFSRGRRQVMRTGFGLVMSAPVALTGYGAFIGRKQFRLVEVELAMPDLAPDLEGLRLVQLTDIHLSPFLSREELRWCVDLANESRAAVGLITGDLVTGSREAIEPCLEELRRLKCPEGLYGCLGNHERYLGAEAFTAAAGQRRGIRFLRQESTEIRIGEARLNLTGIDFRRPAEMDVREVAGLRRAAATNLLLCHNPALYPKTRNQGWDLVVAGHTHGGQLDVEIWDRHLTPVRIATPYVYGVFREGDSQMYVSRGIGTVGVPARIGAPPEVALLRLRRA